MDEIEIAINEIKEELYNEPVIKEYFRLRNIIEKDDALIALLDKRRSLQKWLMENKEDEKYQAEEEKYQQVEKEIKSNPILSNYEVSKEEVYALLLEVKNTIGEK